MVFFIIVYHLDGGGTDFQMESSVSKVPYKLPSLLHQVRTLSIPRGDWGPSVVLTEDQLCPWRCLSAFPMTRSPSVPNQHQPLAHQYS